MTSFDHARATRHSLIFAGTVCGIAIASALLAPSSSVDPPRWLAAWCDLVASLIPGVEGFSSPMPFRTEAYVTLTIMWTLLPLTTYWVYRGDWVMDTNVVQIAKRPWLPVVMSILLVSIVAGFAMLSPDVSDGIGFHGRVLRGAAKSPTSFGVFAGLSFSAMAIGLGTIPKMLRARRDVVAKQSA